MSLTRRKLLHGLTSLPLASKAALNPDAELMALGQEFMQLAAEFDFLLVQPDDHDPSSHRFFDLIARIEPVEDRITNLHATSVRGLVVKADVARWSKQGVIDPSTYSCLDDKMAWSIVRDLVAIAAKGEAR